MSRRLRERYCRRRGARRRNDGERQRRGVHELIRDAGRIEVAELDGASAHDDQGGVAVHGSGEQRFGRSAVKEKRSYRAARLDVLAPTLELDPLLGVKPGVDLRGQLGLGRLEHPCHHEIESAPVSDIGRPDQRTVGSGRAIHTHEHSLHVGSSLHRGHDERHSIRDTNARVLGPASESSHSGRHERFGRVRNDADRTSSQERHAGMRDEILTRSSICNCGGDSNPSPASAHRSRPGQDRSPEDAPPPPDAARRRSLMSVRAADGSAVRRAAARLR